MRRSNLRRRTPIGTGAGGLRRTRLAPVSQKRRDGRDTYEDAKAAVWRRDCGTCTAELTWPEVGCGGRIDPHHVWPQGRYPERRDDPDAMTLVCRAHHDAIHHQDPVRARQLGLLV
ncbi:MAG: hypothetical protein ACRDXE_08200 [Acidimicrobiales bacterium]